LGGILGRYYFKKNNKDKEIKRRRGKGRGGRY
jgi:hypothetical protein